MDNKLSILAFQIINLVMELKKNPKVDLRNKSLLFLQLGLVLVLFFTWRSIEYKTYENEIAEKEEEVYIEEIEEDIPITKMVFRKPPPPPPPPPSIEIIEVIDDKEPEPETVFEETEVEEEEDIPEDVPDFSEVEDTGGEEEEISDVPFALIQEAPLFPGCEKEKGALKRKNCMSKKIDKWVQRKFNTDLGQELGLTGIQKIFVQFKIDKTGKVVDIKARAPHPRLQQEAQRVIKGLPQMKPAKQRNRPVGVIYTKPITFRID